MRSLSRIALIAVVALPVGLPAAAHAAFPGANGKIAYERAGTGGPEIHVVNQDGSGDVSLGAGREPSWSPDGTKIAFRDSALWVMNADGTGRHQIVAGASNAAVRHPTWSPDGNKLAFVREDCTTDPQPTCTSILATVNADGTGETAILSSHSPSPMDPAWSPDGTKIAFSGYALYTDFCCGDLYTISPDGTGLTRLTNSPDFDDVDPDWSPDSRRLVAVNDDVGIYAMNRDGTGMAPVAAPGGSGWPAWSPDQSKFTFGRNGDTYVMKIDGSAVTPLTSGPDFDAEPDWQPIPFTGYARPKGASPFQTYLVPAYKPCTAPNATHGAPLAFPSCSPPQQASDYLTIGTPDSNGQPARSRGVVKLAARLDNPSTPTDEADVAIQISISDVRNKADLSDYTGRLQETFAWRTTDNFNGEPNLTDPATVMDVPIFPVNVPCVATADAGVGSTCAITTSADAVVGSNGFPGHKRTVLQLGKIDVFDGGDDGDPTTDPPSTLFLTQGLLIP